MMNLAEYRRSATRLADFLPWAALVDEGIVLNKDGSFQRTARFRGPDLDSCRSSRARCGRRPPQQRTCVASDPAGRCLWRRSDIHRTPIRRAVVRMWHRRWSMPSAAPQFEEEGAHYKSAYFLTFLYLPPAEDAARAERFLYEGRERAAGCRRSRGRCAALSTGPTACCSWSKGSCRSAGGSMTARP